MSRAGLAAAVLVLLPLAAAAGKAPPPPTLKDLKRATPEIRTGETVAPDPERAKALYRDFLELEGGDAQLRTEAMRRLGDLQLESGDAARGEVAGQGEAETREAIDIYTRLLEQEPDYPRADVVLYQLSRGWEALGEPDKALGYLDRLVAGHPSSPRIVEAQFRRGEILFSAKRYAEAQHAYEAASAFGPDERVLRAEPLQARLVAVQAVGERGFLRAVPARARPEARRRGQAGVASSIPRISPAQTASWSRTLSACSRSASPTWTGRRR